MLLGYEFSIFLLLKQNFSDIHKILKILSQNTHKDPNNLYISKIHVPLQPTKVRKNAQTKLRNFCFRENTQQKCGNN